MLIGEIEEEGRPPPVVERVSQCADLFEVGQRDGVIARALELQNEQLPTELPCPDCGGACVVEFEKRTIQGRFGTAEIQEPLGHCARCARDFFPSASRAAVG